MNASKFDPALVEVGDKILHDLPEEIAAGISFKLHEGGDALVVSYPASWEGTPEFVLFDLVARKHGAAYVSRGKGKSYFLVPRPKHASKQSDAMPAAAEAPKLTVLPKPVAVVIAATPAPEQVDPQLASTPEKPAPQAVSVQKSDSQSQPKQLSPLATFKAKVCVDCSDAVSCTVENMRMCFFVLEMEAFADISRLLTDLPLALSDMSVQFNKMSGSLQKLVDNQTFRTSQKRELPKERHVDGGVTWFWNEAKTYEKALDVENKDSQDFASLKRMLVDASSAGKKGLVVDGYWCFLDSFKKDGILRKKDEVFPKAGGA